MAAILAEGADTVQPGQGKLVRDKIPDLIRQEGGMALTRLLDDQEYARALRMKILEEAAEVSSADDTHLLEELADVYEVVGALATTLDLDMGAVRDAADVKAQARGGFSARIWLDQPPPTAGSADGSTANA